MKHSSSIMRNIIFQTKNAEKSAQFFIDVFGLKINHFSEHYSELADSNHMKLVFMKTKSEPHSRVGYNPLLSFSVIDFDSVKLKLDSYPEVEYDGGLRDNNIGKYACIKNPDGIMIAIMELKSPDVDNEEYSVDIHEESQLDPNTAEIRTILEKIKI
mmetsp:Transcript_3492/g.3522  ORF Transcript_3492/g.3522 Transcript_3492/m.3522 type:complete len:157 (+) Transcript_3492:25-495(+)